MYIHIYMKMELLMSGTHMYYEEEDTCLKDSAAYGRDTHTDTHPLMYVMRRRIHVYIRHMPTHPDTHPLMYNVCMFMYACECK
jgi:hypothetical protein